MNFLETSGIWQSLSSFDPELRSKFISTLLTIVVLLGIRYIASRFIHRMVEDHMAQYKWQKAIATITGVLIVLSVSQVWIKGIKSFTTFLGLFSAGLAVALKDPITNFAGWLFLIWRRPFEMKERVEIGSSKGDVIDISLFRFTLLEIGNWVDADQSTGRIIHIPNSKIFTEPLINFNRGFKHIWNEIPVLITFESNWVEAKAILSQIMKNEAFQITRLAQRQLREASKSYMIFYQKLDPIVYTSVKDSGVMLTIRYLCLPQKRRGTTEMIWEEILHEFSKRSDIDFAYPTQRFYNNISEGKPGWQPPVSSD